MRSANALPFLVSVRSNRAAERGIAGATVQTHVLAAADADKTVRDSVGFEEDPDDGETPTRSATATVAEQGARVEVWSATLTVGSPSNSTAHGYCQDCGESESTENFGSLSDTDFTVGGATYTVQSVRWETDGGAQGDLHFELDAVPAMSEYGTWALQIGADVFSLADTAPGEDNVFTIDDVYGADSGRRSPALGDMVGLQLSRDEAKAANSPATGAPSVSGTARVGETLTVSTSGIDDADGLTAATYSYRWIRVDGLAETGITDARSSAYTPLSGDEDKVLKVRVAFQDDAGNGEALTSAATETVAAPAANVLPGEVGRLESVSTSGQIELAWTEASSAAYWPITGYDLRYCVGAGCVPADDWTSSVTRSYTVGGLTDGTTYVFEVRARNALGAGAASRVSAVPARIPGAVTGLVAMPGDGQVTLSWAGPADDGGAAVTGYEVRYCEGSGCVQPGDWTSTDGVATRHTVDHLTSDAQYTFEVRAVNAGNRSGPEVQVSAMPAAATKAAPGFPATTATRSVVENSGGGLDVGLPLPEATDADGDKLTYRLEGPDAASFDLDAMRQLTTRSDATYDHEAKPEHSLTLKAQDPGGAEATLAVTIEIADVSEPPNAPDAPTVSVPTMDADGALAVSWNAATVPAGAPTVDDYDVRFKKKGAMYWTEHGHYSTATTATLTGLASGTTYEVTVAAKNGEGTEWSDSGEGTTVSAALELSCGTGAVAEGATLNCTLENAGKGSGPWPGVAIFHKSSDGDRALVRGAATDVALGTLTPGARVSGRVWWVGNVIFAYQRFDWSGNAGPGASRTIPIAATDDALEENEEKFYVTMTADGGWNASSLKDDADALSVTVTDGDSASTVASLRELEVREPGTDTALSASRSGNDYSLSVGHGVTEVVIEATPTHGGAKLKIGTEAAELAHGEASRIFTLRKAAVTTIPVVATAEDGTTSETYNVVVTRASRPDNVVVSADAFELTCPSRLEEGASINCTLKNTRATSAKKPIVAIIHTDLDADRATVTEDPVVPSSSASYADDVGFSSGTSADGYQSGYGELFSGGTEQYRTYGFEKFGASDKSLAGNGTESVRITAYGDAVTETDEVFYVGIAPSGYTGLSKLVSNKAPIVIAPRAPGSVALQAPAAITTVSAVAGNGAVALGWALPSDGGSAILRFQVRRKLDSGAWGEWTDIADSGPTTTRYTVMELSGGRGYSFQVRAVNAMGVGGGSDEARSATFEVAENTTAVSTVTATEGAGTGTRYSITGGADQAKFAVGASTGALTFRSAPDYERPGDVASTSPTNAAGNNEYVVVVRATLRGGGSIDQTVTVTVTDEAEQPGTPPAPSVVVTPGHPTTFEVNWSEPTNAGPEIDSYDLRYRVTGSGGNWTNGPQNVTVTSATIIGLTGETSYEVRVRASSDEGDGEWSASGTGETGAVPTAPDAIANLSAVAGNDRVALAWSAPNDGGSAIQRFEFRRKQDSGVWGGWTEMAGSRGSTTDHTVMEVRAGRGYSFQVRAVNAVGGGDASNEARAAAFDVAENTTAVGTLTATEGSVESNLRFAIVDEADAAAFAIEAGTGVLTFRSAPNYERPGDVESTTPPNAAGDNEYVLTVRATRGVGGSLVTEQTVTVTVTDVVERVTLGITGLSNRTVEENAAFRSATPTVTGPPIGNVTWTVEGADAGDVSIDAGTGVVRMAARDFESPLDDDTDNVYEVTVKATDGQGNEATVSFTVTVTDVRETVSLGITGLGNGTVSENSVFTSSAPGLTGTPIGSATWILEGADATDLAIDGSTGVASMVARDFESPADADRDNVYAVTARVTDDDGNTATASFTVTVTDAREVARLVITGLSNWSVAENSAFTAGPGLTGTPIGGVHWSVEGGDAADFTVNASTGVVSMVGRDFETPADRDADNAYDVTVRVTDSDDNTAAVSITVTVTDVREAASLVVTGLADGSVAENARFAAATPSLTGTPIGDVAWAVEGVDSGAFTIDGNTGVLSMVARDFENPQDSGRNNVYAVRVRATDDDGNTAAASIRVTVTDVQEAASLVIGGLSDGSVAENARFTTATPSVTGPPIGDVAWTVEGVDAGDFAIDASTGVVSMVARDYENPVDADTDNVYEVTVRVVDADDNAATRSIAVTVTDASETATLGIAGLSNRNVAENAGFTSATPTVTGTPIGDVAWTVEGADGGDFTIVGSTGVVSMVARDFEAPADGNADNRYEVTVKASDRDGNTATASFTVTVTDVRETVALSIAGLSDGSVSENTAFRSATPSVTGPPVGNVAWTVEGVDAGDFAVEASTGVVSMVARDYENPVDTDTDNAYQVTVRATDDDQNTAVVSITVTVQDADERATLGITGLGNTVLEENRPFSSRPGLTGSPIGTVTWSHEGTDQGDFAIDSRTGVLSMAARNYESPTDSDSDNVYEVTVRVTDDDRNTSTVSFTVTVTDRRETATVTVSVDLDVEPPENQTWTSSAPTAAGAIGNVRWSTSGADAGVFGVGSDGTLTLSGQDYEAPSDADGDGVYEVTLVATDDDQNVGMAAVRVTVSDVVEDSTVTVSGLSDDTTPENVPWSSGAPSASGAIGAVSWTASGADVGAFRIDSATGALTLPAQDFEKPADIDSDNAYEVTATATDSDGNEGQGSITVRVTDSRETATVRIEGLSDDTTPENAAWTSPVPTAAQAIGAVIWDKEGVDAHAFDIDSSSGVLTLSAQDYEDPEDVDRDNVYAVTVKASDSEGNADVEAIEVEVMDVQEASTVRVTGLSDAAVAENEDWRSPEPTATGAIGSLTWRSTGADAGRFTVNSVTGVLWMPARDYEDPADSNRDNVYEVTVRATDEDQNDGESSLRVSVTDVDDTDDETGTPPPRTTPPGGGSGGGAANRPPVVEEQIEDQTLVVGEVLELDIRLNFYDRDQRALDYYVASEDARVVTVEVDRQGVLTLRGIGGGVTPVTVTAADRRDERVSQSFTVTVLGPALGGPGLVPFLPRASDPVREGFVRVINHSAEAGDVSIEAVDDRGSALDPIFLRLDANALVHFNSGDLENGNADKGLSAGVGPGEGDWRLELESELDIEVLSYIRTRDGCVTAMHDTVPVEDGTHRVAILNPASNLNQVSRLRLINAGDETAAVIVTGIDDAGDSPGTAVGLELLAGQSANLTASELESGSGLDGALGDGVGKWRLGVTSDQPIVAMSLLSTPTGHLTNLSTAPRNTDEDGAHVVLLFPAASDALGRQGFLRVVNRSDRAGEVRIAAYDDSDRDYPTVTLALGAGQTVHFNSDDLELGNERKSLSGSTGAGIGDWRLVLSSGLDIQVLAYIRTSDGFLTSMHDLAPEVDGVHRVAIFNPGSNRNQVSRLRLVNPGSEDAEVTVAGVDDSGTPAGGDVVMKVPAGASRTVDAAALESGAEGMEGALGDGLGKWRLTVTSDQPIAVMSVLSSPTGHLTNLSTAPDGGSEPIQAEVEAEK